MQQEQIGFFNRVLRSAHQGTLNSGALCVMIKYNYKLEYVRSPREWNTLYTEQCIRYSRIQFPGRKGHIIGSVYLYYLIALQSIYASVIQN